MRQQIKSSSGAMGWWLRAGGVAALACGWAGCAGDLYTPCELDPQSSSPTHRECAQSGGGDENEDESVTCAVDNFLPCDTRVCARYEGSDGFCTQTCTSDAECGEGVCEDFNPLQPGTVRYCVPDEAL